MKINIKIKSYLPLFFGLILLGCSDDETAMQNELDSTIDERIIGSWRHQNFPAGFTIEETGLLTYLRMNHLTGKFITDSRFEDKILAKEGMFEFLESSSCFVPNDSTYFLNENGYLQIPISQGWQSGPNTYIPFDIESFIGKIRPESYITATIEEKAFWGNRTWFFDSSDELELLEIFSVANPGSFISGYDDPEFNCKLENRFHHFISIISNGPIESVGDYSLVEGTVQYAGQESGNTFNLTYDSHSTQFGEGNLSVTSYSEDENSKSIEGNFEFYLTSEFQGSYDTVRVTNGKLKMTEFFE